MFEYRGSNLQLEILEYDKIPKVKKPFEHSEAIWLASSRQLMGIFFAKAALARFSPTEKALEGYYLNPQGNLLEISSFALNSESDDRIHLILGEEGDPEEISIPDIYSGYQYDGSYIEQDHICSYPVFVGKDAEGKILFEFREIREDYYPDLTPAIDMVSPEEEITHVICNPITEDSIGLPVSRAIVCGEDFMYGIQLVLEREGASLNDIFGGSNPTGYSLYPVYLQETGEEMLEEGKE